MSTPLWKFCQLIFDAVATFLYGIVKYGQKQLQLNLVGNCKKEKEEQIQKEMDHAGDGMIKGEGIDKRKIVYMAVEVWVDVLGFVKRIQLARTVSLTNRHIHQICWPRLHGNKVVAHAVEEMIIERNGFWGQSAMALLAKDGREVPIPTCPQPAYISGFREIQIKFLNSQVLQFLAIISRTSTSQINMNFFMEMSSLDEKHRVNELINIFRRGESSKIYSIFYPLANIQYLTEMDNEMQMIGLISVKESNIPLLMKMLATPRPDGKQTVIIINMDGDNYLAAKIMDTITKEFRASTQPLSQPFYCTMFYDNLVIPPNSVEENQQTEEQLTIISGTFYTDICRHPTGQFERWYEDERKRNLNRAEIKLKLQLNLSADHSFCYSIFCPVCAVRKLHGKLLELMD